MSHSETDTNENVSGMEVEAPVSTPGGVPLPDPGDVEAAQSDSKAQQDKAEQNLSTKERLLRAKRRETIELPVYADNEVFQWVVRRPGEDAREVITDAIEEFAPYMEEVDAENVEDSELSPDDLEEMEMSDEDYSLIEEHRSGLIRQMERHDDTAEFDSNGEFVSSGEFDAELWGAIESMQPGTVLVYCILWLRKLEDSGMPDELIDQFRDE